MVDFCAKCGAYIPPRQVSCSRCQRAESEDFERINLPLARLSAEDVLAHFPSQTFRRYQKEAITAAVRAYHSGKKCVIIIAPTGFGKSYLNASFTSVTKSFYVTPQLALIDQLLADPNLKGRFVGIKGRQNYKCHYSPRRGVHVGKCVTEGYPCNERLDVCPYWMQKHLALQAPSVLMSLAYLILEGTTEGSETYLGTRDLMVLDEAHNLEEQCLNHVSLKFTPFSVPYEIYHKLLPDLRKVGTRTELEVFLADAAGYLKLMLGRLETKSEQREISVIEAENKTLMERFLENYNLFVFSKSEWVWDIRNDQLILQPVFGREFMKDLVWKRGEHYLISSATILDPEEYVELNGLTDLLDRDEIEILEAPSTFSPENRPIIDATVGPLTQQRWESNMPMAVAAVEEILRKEKGNVAIHSHSYRHQRALVAGLPRELKPRLIVHTGKDREEKLQEWMRSRGKVFVSVAFNEGQDWKYEICLMPQEEIITDTGVRKICDIKVGDKVLTHKGRFRRVKSIMRRDYSGPIVSIRPYFAKPFRVTPEHPILTNKGWVRAKELESEYIAYPRLASHSSIAPKIMVTYEMRRNGFHKCPNSSHTANYFREQVRLDKRLTASEMRLIGYYLAEGSVSSHSIHLDFGKTPIELEYAKDAGGLFRQLFSREASIRRLPEGGYQVAFGSIEAARWFGELFGKVSEQKRIPFPWLRAKPELVIELLRGYFRGDGSHSGNAISCVTTSKTLAYQIRFLLARFGIISGISTRNPRGGVIQGRTVRTNESYQVRISRIQANKGFELLGIREHITKKRNFRLKARTEGKYLRGSYLRFKIHSKSTSVYAGPVYNLEVDQDNSYVGTSSIYHNCSAQVLLKVPFPDLGDRRVKRRLELGHRRWYQNQAMLEVIQAYGRAVRAEDDAARFYVVDGSFVELLKTTWNYIPEWFKDALPATLKPNSEN